MVLAVVTPSVKPDKKFTVFIFAGDRMVEENLIKTIHFGANGYEDYTMHKDPKRKERYKQRHRNESWRDYMTAGFWARWLLWNKPTLLESIIDTEKRFKIRIEIL